MMGYQMSCKGRFVNFSGDKVIFNNRVYTNKDLITEEVIEKFKDICCDGDGMFDLDRKSLVITINEVEII